MRKLMILLAFVVFMISTGCAQMQPAYDKVTTNEKGQHQISISAADSSSASNTAVETAKGYCQKQEQSLRVLSSNLAKNKESGVTVSVTFNCE